MIKIILLYVNDLDIQVAFNIDTKWRIYPSTHELPLFR